MTPRVMCLSLVTSILSTFKNRAWNDRKGLLTVFQCQHCVPLGVYTA